MTTIKNQNLDIIIANKELSLLVKEKEKQVAELIAANKELILNQQQQSNFVSFVATSDATSRAWKHTLNDLNKIMNSSPDVICVVDADGKFVRVCSACEIVWGYNADEFIGKSIFEFVHPEDHEKTRKEAENVMSGVNAVNFENRYVRKDGSVVPISWTIKWDSKDKLRYGVARDVTEKKRWEKACETKRRQLYDLFSEAPYGMGIISGPDYKFEMANQPFLELIGKKDIINKFLLDIMPEVFEQGFIEILDDVYNTGKNFTGNEMLIKLDRNGDGNLVDRYINFIAHAHRSRFDKIDGILFFVVNVSEQVLSRKKTEESEARLKEAQAFSHVSSWEVDLLTQESIWSDELYNILGLRRKEVVPSLETFLSKIHPEDEGYVKEIIEKSLTTFERSSFYARIKTGVEETKHIYAECRFDFDEHENPIRLYGILQDVTEQKIAQHKIKESEERYRQIVKTAQEGIWLIDSNNKTTFVNNKICEILEYSEEEMLEKELGFFTDEEGKKIVTELMLQRREGKTGKYQFKYISKTGKCIWTNVSANPIFGDDGVYIGSLGMINDITESKMAEEKDRFQAILLNTIGQAVIATDLQGTISFWNKAAEGIYGWTEEEAIGQNVIDLTPSIQTKEQAMEIVQELSQGRIWSGEFMVKRKDGHIFPAFVADTPIYDKHHKIVGIIGVSHDITEQKDAEKIRESIIGELVRRNKDLEQFSYIVSHNLRSPVANIMGLVGLIESELEHTENKILIEEVSHCVTKLDNVIRDLNFILKVKQGISEKKEDVRFSELVGDIKNSIGNKIKKEQVVIKTDFSEADNMYTLKSYLYSVFFNLLSNCIEYRRPGVVPEIEIKSQKTNGKLTLIFLDNGLGIDLKENGEQVFGMYKRFHPHIQGKGMGLFMVKTQVEALGGKIFVQSEINKGTEFKIEFEIER